MWLYYWEKYGYEKAKIIFKKNYLNDKGHIKKNIPEMYIVLHGKISFLKMVKGDNNSTFLKLKKRFDELNLKRKNDFDINYLKGL